MNPTTEQLEAAIAAANEKLAELKAADAAQAEKAWPQVGDTYFFVDGAGGVVESQWDSDLFDASRTNIGNVFRTVAEAEHEIERRKVLTELRRLAKASGKTTWPNRVKNNYRLAYNVSENRWGLECSSIVRTQGAVYFHTEAAAKTAIETIGADRLMLLLED